MITPKQAQIIRLLMVNKEGFNINQIARTLDISVSWTHEAVRQLERQDILKSVKKANSIVFTLDWNNPLTEKICEILLIESRIGNKQKTWKIKGVEKGVVAAQTTWQETDKAAYNQVIKTGQMNYSSAYGLTKTQADSGYSAIRETNQLVYSSINPVGSKGFNNTLTAYAQSGAFGSTYSAASQQPSGVVVPPDTLASRVTSNVSGFTLSIHTSSHRITAVTGCRYCDSV